MSGLVSVLADCPQCRVECAVLEAMDGETRAGRCRMCGLATVGLAVAGPGRSFASAAEVEAALTSWAAEEGEPDVVRFVYANFTGLSLDQVTAAVLRGERVSTSFDVVAWLFRDRTGGHTALGGVVSDSRAVEPRRWTHDGIGVGGGFSGGGGASPPATPPPQEEAARPALAPSELRTTTRALCAVLLADGERRPEEERVMAAELARLGAPPAEEADWRLWRPQEMPWPPDPEGTLLAMRRIAVADRQPDPSEERIIREFARAWRVPLKEPVLSPVTLLQHAVHGWNGLFGR